MFADNDNVLKLSEHIKNNPFAKINDDDSLFGSSSKAILRQSRLQYASLAPPLTASIPALSPLQITNATTVNVNTENLFASSLAISTFNRNAIPRKHNSSIL